MKRTRYLLALGFTSAAALGLIACGDSKDNADAPATQTQAPESRRAPDAEVASGLKRLARIADGISRIKAEAASKKASAGLEPVWMKVEGTVKANEPDIYATIEEDLSLLESGDAKKTQTGAGEMRTRVDAYLAKHPG